jgi:hypothetical protein
MAAQGRTAADKDKSDALAQMNLSKILRAYMHQMVEEVPGYKAFLLDKETMRVCSTLYGRTELADHSLVHIERVDGNDGADHVNLKVCCAWARSAGPARRAGASSAARGRGDAPCALQMPGAPPPQLQHGPGRRRGPCQPRVLGVSAR